MIVNLHLSVSVVRIRLAETSLTTSKVVLAPNLMGIAIINKN